MLDQSPVNKINICKAKIMNLVVNLKDSRYFLLINLILAFLVACTGKNPDYIYQSNIDVIPNSGDYPDDLHEKHKRIFVTEGMYQGFLINDQNLCQYSAGAGDMRGVWVPWVSIIDTMPVDAIERIRSTGPWYDLKENLIFGDRDALRKSPALPLLVDQYGKEVPAGEPVWTGTLPGGGLSGNICFDKTAYRVWHANSQSENGDVGLVGMVDSNWTFSHSLPCTEKAHIVCIEQ